MNITNMINVIKGKADVAVSKVKSIVDNDPRKAATYGLLGTGLATVTYSLATGDAEQISNALGNTANAVSRAASFYAPEIVGNSAFAVDFLNNAVSAVDYHQILEDEGLLKGSGAVLMAGYTEVKNDYSALDSPLKKKVKQGALLAVVAALTAASGCLGSGEVKTPPNVAEVNYEPVETPAVETSTVEPTAEPTEAIDHPYDISKPNVAFGTFESELLDGEVEGYKIESSNENSGGDYAIFNSDKEKILDYEALGSNYDQRLLIDLQPEQYKALTDKYGVIDNLVMETDYENGLVAMRYEGSKGVLEFETDYREGAALGGYMYEMIKTKIQ